MHKDVCVVCEDESRLDQARLFADNNGYPLYRNKNSNYALQLIFSDEFIELFDTQLNTGIHVDFVHGALAHRQLYGGGRGQLIAKAVGLKKGNTPSVLDVTAGLARDAYILACMGCHLTLVEQSPVLAIMIRDGVERGLLSEESSAVLNNNFELHNMNAVEYMKNINSSNRPDVIYIDPMYPHRKKSALVKKDMQILQHLLGDDENAVALLETGLVSALKRVVVKRPVHAENLGDHKPATSISSKKTRYDIYLTR